MRLIAIILVLLIGICARLYPALTEYPYLQESDGYYYQDLINNSPKRIEGGKYLNEKMCFPKGQWEPFTLHPYIGKVIPPKIVPLVLFAVSLAPFAILSYKWRLRPLITFTVGMFLALSPTYIMKTQYAWFDNDGYNVIFPMAILTGMLLNWDIAIITGFLVLYSFFWQGWIWIAVLLLFSRYRIAPFLAMLVLTLIWGYEYPVEIIRDGWYGFTAFVHPSKEQRFYSKVGELKKMGTKQIVEDLF